MLNSINNYFQRQGTSPDKVRVDLTDSTSTNEPRIYATGSVFSGTVGGQSVNLTGDPLEDNSVMWSTIDATVLAPSQYFVSTPHNHNFPNPYTPVTAQQAFTNLITNGDVGAYKYLDDNGYVQEYRDSYDASLLSAISNDQYYTKSTSNMVLPSLPSNTRPSSYDTDNDGMSDAWEIRTYGDLSQSYRDDYDGDGVPNIEEYMNQVDTDNITTVAVTGISWDNDSQIVELGGYLDLSYTFSPLNATDQTFTLSSSNTSVVSNAGSVVGVGTAVLTITTNDGGFTDTMNVTVTEATTPSGSIGDRIKKSLFQVIFN